MNCAPTGRMYGHKWIADVLTAMDGGNTGVVWQVIAPAAPAFRTSMYIRTFAGHTRLPFATSQAMPGYCACMRNGVQRSKAGLA